MIAEDIKNFDWVCLSKMRNRLEFFPHVFIEKNIQSTLNTSTNNVLSLDMQLDIFNSVRVDKSGHPSVARHVYFAALEYKI